VAVAPPNTPKQEKNIKTIFEDSAQKPYQKNKLQSKKKIIDKVLGFLKFE